MLTHFRNLGHQSSKKPSSDTDLNVEMNERLVNPQLSQTICRAFMNFSLCYFAREFSKALGFDTGSYMLGRFFKIFDANGDGKINFQEFLKALSFLCDKATTAEKIKCPCIGARPEPTFLALPKPISRASMSRNLHANTRGLTLIPQQFPSDCTMSIATGKSRKMNFFKFSKHLSKASLTNSPLANLSEHIVLALFSRQ